MKELFDAFQASQQHTVDVDEEIAGYNHSLLSADTRSQLMTDRPMTRIQAALLLTNSSRARSVIDAQTVGGFDKAIAELQQLYQVECVQNTPYEVGIINSHLQSL